MSSQLTVARVDGVLLLDKPLGITSNAALQKVKRLFSAAKAGHVGTLDPLASGLLPVCLGEATKFSADSFSADKAYDAEIQLGVTTTTGDSEGQIISQHEVDVDRAQVAAILERFKGAIAQKPPMYSALKRDGKPLYAYARAGQTIEVEPRTVIIHDIELCDFAGDRFRVNVRCGKGTYIRVLAEDIGRALGCGAMLARLRRTVVGAFDLTRAITLAQLEAMDTAARLGCLLAIDALVDAFPPIYLEDMVVGNVLNGRSVPTKSTQPTGVVRLYDQDRHFLGLGEVRDGGQLYPRRLVARS